jgi:hypothetical protein
LTFTVEIKLKKDDSSELENPAFRFKWLHVKPDESGDVDASASEKPFFMGGGEEDRIETLPAVKPAEGAVVEENGWTDSTMIEYSDENPAPEYSDENPAPVPDPDGEGLLCWKLQREIGEIDKNWASKFSEEPFLNIVLSDKNTEKATMLKLEGLDAKSGPAEPEPGMDQKAVVEGGRNFIELFPIDMSAMLSGETVICQEFGTKKGGNKKGKLPLPPAGLDRLIIRVSINEPLLKPDLRNELNPLSIELTKVVDCPGITVTSKALEYCLEPTPFALLEKYCRPVYATFKFFDGDSVPRVTTTAALRHGPTLKWGCKTTFLAGEMDRQEVEEHIESNTLLVELHDRDLTLLHEKWWPAAVARWERQVVGGTAYSDAERDELAKKAGYDSLAAFEASEPEAPKKGKKEVVVPKVPAHHPAIDFYDVGEIAAREMMSRASTEGDRQTHGVAKFRLTGLLDESKLLADAYLKKTALNAKAAAEAAAADKTGTLARRSNKSAEYLKRNGQVVAGLDGDVDDKAPELTPEEIEQGVTLESKEAARVLAQQKKEEVRIKETADVCQAKRRVEPKNTIDELDYSAEVKIVTKPATYLDHGCQMTVVATLAHPLRSLAESNCQGTGVSTANRGSFARMAFVFKYENTSLLNTLMDACDAVNKAALPEVVSLLSYALSEEEQQAANKAELDIITGWQVIDADYRIIVVEGIGNNGGPGKGMQRVADAIPREELGANDKECKILWNPHICFKRRLYTEFNVDLKKVKLREPLPTIVKDPAIYNRSKVSTNCFEALHRLSEAMEAERLVELQEMDVFPLPRMLVELENKFGDAVSLDDILGVDDGTGGGRRASIVSEEAALGMSLVSATEAGATKLHTKQVFKAATDQKNAAFAKAKKNKVEKDYLGEQKIATKTTIKMIKQKIKKELEETAGEEVIYTYSGQALQYTEAKKKEMREKLVKDKNATYTYSNDFQSLAVEMVDEVKVARDEAAESKGRWKTGKGFVYPAPRPASEFNKHPMQPSKTRCVVVLRVWFCLLCVSTYFGYPFRAPT